MAVRNPPKNDFDADHLARQVDDHAKDMAYINKRLDDLENKFGTHERIAATLSETTMTAVKMQDLFSTTFVRLICTDDKIRDALTSLINKVDRNWFYAYCKRVSVVTGSLFLLILGAIAKTLSDKYLH